jgi:CRISPR-associated protein Csc1
VWATPTLPTLNIKNYGKETMVSIYHCSLELHDNLYFATREIGRLYETEAVLHNYALCYALGLVDNPHYGTQVDEPEDEYRYFCRHQVPKYKQHLSRFNDVGIYVTPAIALRHTSSLNTWKYADNCYHVEMTKTQKNIPSFGRAKEIAPESQFIFFVISRESIELKFPHWIRLGKWMSKARLSVDIMSVSKKENEDFLCQHPLNPLDVMSSHQVQSFDTINMPPVSLIQNVFCTGAVYSASFNGRKIQLPAHMKFTF